MPASTIDTAVMRSVIPIAFRIRSDCSRTGAKLKRYMPSYEASDTDVFARRVSSLETTAPSPSAMTT